MGNPLGVPFFLANGDKAWFGWPKNEEYENLRGKWSDVDTLAGGQALARKMQGIWWDFVGAVMLGHYFAPSAHRTTLTGLIPVLSSALPMWNMRKTSA